MKMLFPFLLLSALASGVFAHSRVDRTVPEDGATIAAAPDVLSLSFAADIRLTRVELTHQDQHSVRLDLGEQRSFAQEFSIPFQDMGQGRYRIEWRGLGVDGHSMQGAFSFTVD
ncbi:copper resistance CopC family protein [Roseobacter sp. SK209-2-6]|uniref:copper resistance CopC family protein n=1 Tax=Roseobacter sp. SK209-2-6 TaxID=388739 RepID=UPI0002F1ECAB|nr:copper resistance CopC family protein [Roseobacter sp. SK209-2-6]